MVMKHVTEKSDFKLVTIWSSNYSKVTKLRQSHDHMVQDPNPIFEEREFARGFNVLLNCHTFAKMATNIFIENVHLLLWLK